MIQLKGVCIVSEMPTEIHRDAQNRLHSENGPAVKFGDGYEFRSLWGVRFPVDLHNQVCSKEMSGKEILKIENIEQRMAALKLRGPEKLIEEMDAKHIATSERGNSLYFIKELFSTPAYFLKYKDPSTERIYISGVDPEIGICGDPDACMAWKFGLNPAEYSSLDRRNEA